VPIGRRSTRPATGKGRRNGRTYRNANGCRPGFMFAPEVHAAPVPSPAWPLHRPAPDVSTLIVGIGSSTPAWR
jgi:hypothetical protein